MATETETAPEEAGVSMPTPPRENLVRAVMPGVEFRSSENGGAGTLHGHFAVFNDWTEINSMWEGQFMERIAPGAFKKTFQENRAGMKVLFDHGHDPNVGNKPLGQITDLREDDVGASYEVDLIDTSYTRDLVPGLKAGLYGASFRFRVIREDIEDNPKKVENAKGIPERTIREAQVMEFGPVTFPAYQAATAGVRSMTDDFIMQQFLTQPDKLRSLLSHFLPVVAAEEGDREETAPTEDRAELEAHPVVVRRDTQPLFGLDRKDKPAWLL